MTTEPIIRQKYLTERDGNRLDKKKLFSGCKPIKFERIKKESGNIQGRLQTNQCQTSKNLNKLFPYDYETLKDMVKMLKEENGEIKQVMKIQQTQINYFQQQEKAMIENSSEDESLKKLKLTNYQLKRSVQNLKKQNEHLKRNPKHLHLKELETLNELYLEEIKNLNAKLKVFKRQNSNYNVEELNKIIENEYLTSIQNQKLTEKIKENQLEIENSTKIVRKMKNLVAQKNREIDELKQMLDQATSAMSKNKNQDESAQKNELISKKKQLLIMSEKIETLELKLNDCENKVQSLKQENIENISAQAHKRKELATSYHELKKKYEILEEAFNQSMKKGSQNLLQQIRLDKAPSDTQQCFKKKTPLVVSIDSVKSVVEEMVYKFQKSKIEQDEGIQLIISDNVKQEEGEDSYNQRELTSISLRKLMYKLDQSPISIADYHEKQLLARYLVEDPSDDNPNIDFDSEVNISYVKSILQKVLNNYLLFEEEVYEEQKSIMAHFLKHNEHTIRATLNTIKINHEGTARGAIKYQHSDILEGIKREGVLTQITEQFAKFFTFDKRDDLMTYDEFCNLFKKEREQQCTFLTENLSVCEN